MSNSRHFIAENDTERLVLYNLRRAKIESKRRPQTFVIRVVDGIVQVMRAEPLTARDFRHLDKQNGHR